MKVKRDCLFLLLVFIFVLFANAMDVSAINTGFKTDQLSKEEKSMFISNTNISMIDEEPVKSPVTCIDVSGNQLIAIGQNKSGRKTICIYSNKGIFQYGYTFNCNGDFGVEWDEENLNIYFVRSDVIISVTPAGEVLDVVEVQNTIENNSYVNHFIHSTKRIVGDTEYSIENNMGVLNLIAASYSQVIVKYSTGEKSIIYDVGSKQTATIITAFIVFVVIFVVCALVSWQFMKRQGTVLCLDKKERNER